MTPKKTTSVLDELAQRRADLFEAQRNAGRLEYGHQESAQQLRDAEQAIASYHRDVAEGRRAVDDAEESRLIDAKQRLAGRLQIRPDGSTFDPKVAAEQTVANRAARDAEAGLAEWVRANREPLIVALLEQARQLRDDLAALPAHVRALSRRWSTLQIEWTSLEDALGVDVTRETPHDPLDNVRTQADPIAAKLDETPHMVTCAPWSLLDDDDFGPALAPGRKLVPVPGGMVEPQAIRIRREQNRPRPDTAA